MAHALCSFLSGISTSKHKMDWEFEGWGEGGAAENGDLCESIYVADHPINRPAACTT